MLPGWLDLGAQAQRTVQVEFSAVNVLHWHCLCGLETKFHHLELIHFKPLDSPVKSKRRAAWCTFDTSSCSVFQEADNSGIIRNMATGTENPQLRIIVEFS
jgi:hypothetical protein